jgi:hypothetical protein
MRLPLKVLVAVVGVAAGLVVLFLLFEYVIPHVLPTNF